MMGNNPSVDPYIENRINILTKAKFFRWTVAVAICWTISVLLLIGYVATIIYHDEECATVVCVLTQCCPTTPTLAGILYISFIIMIITSGVLELILGILRWQYTRRLRNEEWLMNDVETAEI